MVTLHIYLSRDIKFSIPPYHVSLKNKNCMKENKFKKRKMENIYIYARMKVKDLETMNGISASP